MELNFAVTRYWVTKVATVSPVVNNYTAGRMGHLICHELIVIQILSPPTSIHYQLLSNFTWHIFIPLKPNNPGMAKTEADEALSNDLQMSHSAYTCTLPMVGRVYTGLCQTWFQDICVATGFSVVPLLLTAASQT